MANERGYIKIWTEFVYKVKAKVNFALEQAMKALTGNYSIALLFNLGATFGGWLTPHSGRFTPGKENRYPLHRKLCGPQGWCRWVRKTWLPPAFDPSTVQPVPSHNTDRAIPALGHPDCVGAGMVLITWDSGPSEENSVLHSPHCL